MASQVSENPYSNPFTAQPNLIDNYEIQNSVESSYLQTDEDAEFKRAILQLIYVDDVTGLMDFLQLAATNRSQPANVE